MSETNFNLSETKPETSKLAIAAFLIPVISMFGSYCFIFLIQHDWRNLHPFFESLFGLSLAISFFLCAMPLLSLFGFVFGIFVLLKIFFNEGILKDYAFTILGIALSVTAFFCAELALGCQRPEANIRICQSVNMAELHKAIAAYSKTNNNQYPTSDQWCDLLVDRPNIKKWVFLCPNYPDKNGGNLERPYKCFYAINPNAEPNSAGDAVLLFETKDGWNQFGGPELMSFDNHYRKGCNVLFNDGHTEFVNPKKKDKLNWDNKKID